MRTDVRHVRATAQLAAAEVETLAARSLHSTDPAELMTRPTGQIRSQQLIDLLDATVADEGIVDVHALEMARRPTKAVANKHVAPTGVAVGRSTAKMPPLR